MVKIVKTVLVAALVVFFIAGNGLAMEINKKLFIGGIMVGAYQFQSVSGAPGSNDTGRGGFSFQPEITFTPTGQDTFFANFGFGAGNGLNDGTSPFVLNPWAADLEADVKNIGGRDRDYLLTAWYRHVFHIGANTSFGLTGGLIDATVYIDANAFANDQNSQFMNAVFVNAQTGFLPSYDLGGVLELESGAFSLKGVYMNLGQNDNGNTYNYYGAQIAINVNPAFGEGNYRIIGDVTSADFNNPAGTKRESLKGAIFSFDQMLGKIFGIWGRFGWQDTSAAVDYMYLYSGGININCIWLGRKNDNIGVGVAYLNQGSNNIDNTVVAETYYRFAVNDFLAVTFDVQYMKDTMITGNSPGGFICGLRVSAEI